jgi:cytochrome oxidase assembly protein ShyY1
MMTGIPPPRYFDYNWQVSRLHDKGFSKSLCDLVAMMLNHSMARRPDSLTLVNMAEDGWRYWRANTQEGGEYVDVKDDFLINKMKGGRPGRGLMNMVGM